MGIPLKTWLMLIPATAVCWWFVLTAFSAAVKVGPVALIVLIVAVLFLFYTVFGRSK